MAHHSKDLLVDGGSGLLGVAIWARRKGCAPENHGGDPSLPRSSLFFYHPPNFCYTPILRVRLILRAANGGHPDEQTTQEKRE